VAGLAESVKHAAIRDPAFLTWQETHAAEILGRQEEVMEELIARNVAIKAGVVEADEREARLRQILNYGHTIGHAVERLLDYELRHGECVSLGMIVENRIAANRGLLSRAEADRIARLLGMFGLPTQFPRFLPPGEIIAATRGDKKVRGASVTYVLLGSLGEPVWVNDLRDEEIAAALAQPGATDSAAGF
jgi:3-dehydroquinate synthase